MTPADPRLATRAAWQAARWLVMVAALAAGTACDRAGAGSEKDRDDEAKTKPATEAAGHHDRVKLSKEALEENHVKAEPVAKHVLVPRLHAAARVTVNAEATARVGSPVAGRIGEIKVHLGDAVKKGDELIVVDSTDLGEAQGDLLQKTAAVGAADAAAEAARVSFERGKSLLEKSEGLAKGEVEKRLADLRAAQAAALSAKAAATAARSKLQLLGMADDAIAQLLQNGQIRPKYSVRAPIDGRVIRLDATQGALVAPDKDAPLDLADLTTVWVLADVPEPLASEVRPGAAAAISTSSSSKPLEGKVAYVAPVVDPATRSVSVRVVVPNESGALRPGMFATADIEEATDKPPEPVLAVPDDAVQTIEGETVVFVPAEEEGSFDKKTVKVGEAVGEWVPVLSGLKEGNKVVTEGAFVLKAELAKPAEE